MKLYFIGDNKEVVIKNHYPSTFVGNAIYPNKALKRIVNIDPYNKENIMKFRGLHWNKCALYAQPLGTILLDFLETNLDNIDEFKNLIYSYGVDCLTFNSQSLVETIQRGDKEGNPKKIPKELSEKVFKTLYELNCEYLKNAQKEFQLAIEQCLIDDSMYGKQTPQQRYFIYKMQSIANPHLKEHWLEVETISQSNKIDMLTYNKCSIERYATNITEESFLFSDWYIDELLNDTSFSDKKMENMEIEFIDGYIVFNIATVCYLEFKKMLSSNLLFRYCKHCDKLFLVSDNKRAVYCDRIIAGQKEPCNVIGPRKTYYENLKEKPIEFAYRNAYKTHYARIRSAKDKRKAKADFMDWADEAKLKKEEALKSILSEDEFIKWLKA